MDSLQRSAELAASSRRLRDESAEAVSRAKKIVHDSREIIKFVRRERAAAKAAASAEYPSSRTPKYR